MKFKRIRSGIGCVVLLCGIASAGEDAQLRVLVHQDTPVPNSTLEHARAEAVRIFRGAGIELSWINCSRNVPVVECQASTAENVLYLNVVSRGRSSHDMVFGEAYLDERGKGKVADVFYDRVEDAQRELGISEGRLLGAVAAHEIGHLVLGHRSHQWIGIMTRTWDRENLRLLGMGAFFFGKEQAIRMRQRLCGMDRFTTIPEAQAQESGPAKPATNRGQSR